MTQRRYLNFGDWILSSGQNELTTSLISPMILSGGEITLIDSYYSMKIRVSPIAVIFPSGVVLSEDEYFDINLSSDPYNIPFTATQITVYYEHVYEQVIRGVPATINVIEGLIPQENLNNSVVLCYIVKKADETLTIQNIIRPVAGRMTNNVYKSGYSQIYFDAMKDAIVLSSDFVEESDPSYSTYIGRDFNQKLIHRFNAFDFNDFLQGTNYNCNGNIVSDYIPSSPGSRIPNNSDINSGLWCMKLTQVSSSADCWYYKKFTLKKRNKYILSSQMLFNGATSGKACFTLGTSELDETIITRDDIKTTLQNTWQNLSKQFIVTPVAEEADYYLKAHVNSTTVGDIAIFDDITIKEVESDHTYTYFYNDSGTKYITLLYPFITSDRDVGSFALELSVPSTSSSVTATIINPDGDEYELDNNVIGITSGMQIKRFRFPVEFTLPNSQYHVKLVIKVNSADTVKLGFVGYTDYNLPV